MRFFNTAGPIVAGIHYHVPPLQRLDYEEVLMLIRQQKYFVLHAPRQTGKTTALLALRDELNAGGEFRCVDVNVEVGQAARENVYEGMRAILSALARGARRALGDQFVTELRSSVLDEVGPNDALAEALSLWAEADAKPLVLMIDEIDSLVGDTLLSVLRQLRAGYPERPRGFPQSVILCGVRDVRDYSIRSGGVSSVTITDGGSGYTAAPTVTFAAPPAGGTTAAGAVTLHHTVAGVRLTDRGSGYVTAPSVTFSGGSTGTAATATAMLRGPRGNTESDNLYWAQQALYGKQLRIRIEED